MSEVSNGYSSLKEIMLSNKTNSSNNFYVVGIGTSAGGLKALHSFFKSCPDKTGMAFVVVQHLSPDYKSLMPELLAKHTNMPVAEADDEVEVEPNKVYLIPGRKNITIAKGRLVLQNRPPTKQLNFSIDIFLESLAIEMGHLSIGVILSGTGSDGTKGAKAIKEAGGAVFTQTPASSGFDGMPRSVISHNLADYILDPQDMVNEISQYVKNPQFNYLISGTDLSHKMESIDRILKVVKDNTDIDFTGYKMPTILRRTAKRLNLKKSETIEEYIDLLYKDKAEANALAQEYLIGVTTFFRNPKVFAFLKTEIIPNIVRAALEAKRDIKIWIIACSTGEEVYTLGILLEEHLASLDVHMRYKIYATDIDENAIYKASRGIYSAADVKSIDKDLLGKYFLNTHEGYKISLGIRQSVIFSKHNVVSNPPFSKMDLVSCRNVLIYFDTDNKTKTMNSIKYSLNPEGYLLLGNSETPGVFDKSFKPINTKFRVYQNKGVSAFVPPGLKNWTLDRNLKSQVTGRRKTLSVEEIVNKAFQSKILDEYKSASVCVDETLKIIHAVGKLKRYINILEDGFSNSLSKILPDNVLIPIQSGIRKLEREKLPEVSKNVRLEIEDKQVSLKVKIESISLSNYFTSTYLITFLEIGSSPIPKGIGGKVSSLSGEEIRMLKESLKETKENLQLTIEELETSNEEMQATNEELLAANEELQSTNEELQSVNEELHTVNAELQEKNTTLIELNTDIENLFQNVQVGTLFLDSENNIRRYTPKIKEHFNFRVGDRGRSISLYSGNSILGSDLAKMAEEVKQSGIKKQIEIQHPNGSWFWVEVFPYRDSNKDVKGATVNFININKLKKQSEELSRVYQFLDELTDNSPSLISLIDLESSKRIFVQGNPKYFIGVTKQEIIDGFEISSLLLDDNKQGLKKHFKKLTESQGVNVVSKLHLRDHLTKEKKWVSVVSKVIERNTKGKPTKCLNVMIDITPIVSKENELKASEERYRLALTSQKTGIWECKDINEGTTWWSEEYKNLLGYADKTYEKGYQHFQNLIHPDDLQNYTDSVTAALEKSAAFSCLIRLKIKKEGHKWFEVNGFAEKSKEAKVRVICSVSLSHGKIVDRLIIQSKQKQLENIYKNAPIGFVIINKQGVIQESSLGFNKILDVKEKEAIGTKFIKLTGKISKNSIAEEFKRLVNYDFPFITYEKKYIINDKTEKWCHHHVSPISVTNEEGLSETMYCGIISDITDQHRYEVESGELKKEMYEMNLNATKLITQKLKGIETQLSVSKKGQLEVVNIKDKLSEIYSNIANVNQHFELLKTEKTFANVNLNKSAKKLAMQLKKLDIKLSYDVLPGVVAVESQIVLLLKDLCLYLNRIAEIKDKHLTLMADGAKGDWIINVSGVASKVTKNLLVSSQKYLKEGTGLEDDPTLKVMLISCKSIANGHKGNLELSYTPKKKNIGFTISIKA